jgi:hypothetical protein
MTSASNTILEDRSGYRVRLADDFRFVHEPRGAAGESSAFRTVARDEDLSEFLSRMEFSHGGAFPLAGYGGVGKTTFVNETVTRLRKRFDHTARNGHKEKLLTI